jgi:hypothetical protein
MWKASDADGDDLTAIVRYSADGGQTWTALAVDATGESYTVDPQQIAGTEQGVIQVLVTDGIRTAITQNTTPFTVQRKPPEATIFSPRDGASYRRGFPIFFDGQGFDRDDGVLPGASLQWLSSIDGALGTGRTLQVDTLSEGLHTITLRVADAQSNEAQASIQLVVHPSSQTDLEPPQTMLSVAGTAGNNGWYVSPATITLAATDSGSGVRETQYRLNGGTWVAYTNPFTIANEGVTIVEFRSTDLVGNIETTQRTEIAIDTRRPQIMITLDQPAYTRVDPFVVRFRVEDPMPGSGISSVEAAFDGASVVPGDEIDLFWKPLGQYPLSVSATDIAGWDASNTASVELIATLDSLGPTIRRLRALGEIDRDGIAQSMLVKVEGAIAARDRGQRHVLLNKLDALLNELAAQRGKHISIRGADLLADDVRYVQDYLP